MCVLQHRKVFVGPVVANFRHSTASYLAPKPKVLVEPICSLVAAVEELHRPVRRFQWCAVIPEMSYSVLHTVGTDIGARSF